MEDYRCTNNFITISKFSLPPPTNQNKHIKASSISSHFNVKSSPLFCNNKIKTSPERNATSISASSSSLDLDPSTWANSTKRSWSKSVHYQLNSRDRSLRIFRKDSTPTLQHPKIHLPITFPTSLPFWWTNWSLPSNWNSTLS